MRGPYVDLEISSQLGNPGSYNDRSWYGALGQLGKGTLAVGRGVNVSLVSGLGSASALLPLGVVGRGPPGDLFISWATWVGLAFGLEAGYIRAGVCPILGGPGPATALRRLGPMVGFGGTSRLGK